MQYILFCIKTERDEICFQSPTDLIVLSMPLNTPNGIIHPLPPHFLPPQSVAEAVMATRSVKIPAMRCVLPTASTLGLPLPALLGATEPAAAEFAQLLALIPAWLRLLPSFQPQYLAALWQVSKPRPIFRRVAPCLCRLFGHTFISIIHVLIFHDCRVHSSLIFFYVSLLSLSDPIRWRSSKVRPRWCVSCFIRARRGASGRTRRNAAASRWRHRCGTAINISSDQTYETRHIHADNQPLRLH